MGNNSLISYTQPLVTTIVLSVYFCELGYFRFLISVELNWCFSHVKSFLDFYFYAVEKTQMSCLFLLSILPFLYFLKTALLRSDLHVNCSFEILNKIFAYESIF